MKLTMHIDEALREMDRRTTLRKLAETNLGLTEKEILEAFDEHYHVIETRSAELAK